MAASVGGGAGRRPTGHHLTGRGQVCGGRILQRSIRIALFFGLSAILVTSFSMGVTSLLSNVAAVVVLTSLLTMTLVALLIEHYFGTPSTVLATSVAGVLLLAPAYSGLAQLGTLYWVLVTWCVALVVVASTALLMLPDKEAKGEKASRARALSTTLKGLSVSYGNGRLVFGLIAIATAVTYLKDEPILVGLTVVYVVAIFGLNTSRPTGRRRSAESVAGEITRVEPSGVVKATVAGCSDVSEGAHVAYMLVGDDESMCRFGVVARVFSSLDGQQAIILGDDRHPVPAGLKLAPGDVAVLPTALTPTSVGIVADGSRISSIRVQTLSLQDLCEGSLLSVRGDVGQGAPDVLYQVVDARVCSDGPQALTVADAVQLGVWSDKACGFLRHGWVPPVNALVEKVQGDCSTALPEGSLLLGHLPGTNFPIAMDRNALRGTHIAVLGVTGSGKSVTSRYLVRELSSNGTRVVVVDLTGEYKRLLIDPAPNPIISDEARERMTVAIEALMRQMAEFANKRIQKVIDDNEAILDKEFRDALHAWLASDDGTYALLELPSFENTATSLEYTRWFLRTLFDIARTEGFGGEGKSVTVVLEEAHTVVPEWNFTGAKGDKSAEGLLNSIAQIALQGRKYGIGFIVIAQRTANVSKTVLTQCSSVIAFRSYDNTSADFLANYLGDDLVKALPNLENRHAIVVGSAFHSQVPLICRVLDVDEPEADPAASTLVVTADAETPDLPADDDAVDIPF